MEMGGVGYLVHASQRTLGKIGQKGEAASLLIETAVREDAITLYGFADAAEQEWFKLLTSVQGVGAKAGLAILSVCPPKPSLFHRRAGQSYHSRRPMASGQTCHPYSDRRATRPPIWTSSPKAKREDEFQRFRLCKSRAEMSGSRRRLRPHQSRLRPRRCLRRRHPRKNKANDNAARPHPPRPQGVERMPKSTRILLEGCFFVSAAYAFDGHTAK
ncbi:MAG: hypothetical protein H6861_09795 [Rhodospirillales bacterium]|nr:hypothetical protein [Rhodospirillales bacterium]